MKDQPEKTIMVHHVFDSAGTDIKPGDMVECPDLPADSGERWNITAVEYGKLQVRDLGNNVDNVGFGPGVVKFWYPIPDAPKVKNLEVHIPKESCRDAVESFLREVRR